MKSTVRQLLTAKLGSLITDTMRVVELSSSAMSGTVSYVGTETVNLPRIVVQSADIYVFRVYLRDLVGTLSWTPNVSNASTGEYIEASDEENNAVFLDDSGQEITEVPDTKYVNVAAYFEPGKAYEPAITATSGDVQGVGSSSGGCDAGLGAIVSAIAAAFFISKKRS